MKVIIAGEKGQTEISFPYLLLTDSAEEAKDRSYVQRHSQIYL